METVPVYYVQYEKLQLDEQQLDHLERGSADEYTLKLIYDVVQTNPDIKLKRGDFVSAIDIDDEALAAGKNLSDYRDRNDGVLVFNGHHLENLYSEVDDYGSVSPEFSYPEFPLNYFVAETSHNNIVWLSKDVCQAALNGIFTATCDDSSDEYGILVEFTFNDQPHRIKFHPDPDNFNYTEEWETILKRGLTEGGRPFEFDEDEGIIHVQIYAKFWWE